MRNLIIQWDHWLFLKINTQWVHPLLDTFFATLTNLMKTNWFVKGALPAVLIGLILWHKKRGLQVIVSIAITVSLTDFISYQALKSYFERPRPHHTSIGAIVRVPYAPTSRSMPSNHALNTFAIANILAFYWPMGTAFYWLFAVLMAYSRVYVGVHYPLDIFAGMILGIFLAVVIRRGVLLRMPWFTKEIK